MSWHNETRQLKNLAFVPKNVPSFGLADNLPFGSARRLKFSESYIDVLVEQKSSFRIDLIVLKSQTLMNSYWTTKWS